MVNNAAQEALYAEFARARQPGRATPLFQLRDIPEVMRARLGWPVSATLMERWFDGAAYRAPLAMRRSRIGQRIGDLPQVHLDDTTVTMEWAMGFERVQAAVAAMPEQWVRLADQASLRARVAQQGQRLVQRQPWRFGDLAQSANVLEDTCQVGALALGDWGDPFDDFYGAMGSAQLQVAVSGIVRQGAGLAWLEVDELGLYLRHSYDFNDSPSHLSLPLGCWGLGGVECRMKHVAASEFAPACWGVRGTGCGTRLPVRIEQATADEDPDQVQQYRYIVQNEDFRRWRRRHRKGGDFMVLSDVLTVPLPVPVEIPL